MPRSRLILLAACLWASACACGPAPGADAGPDDAGRAQTCRFFGESCESADECCDDLVCRGTGLCGHPPGCEGDDEIAGAPSSPTELDQLQPGDVMLSCPGRQGLDAFSVTAAAGEVLRITLLTEGLDPDSEVQGGEPDVDMYLLLGEATGIEDGVVQGNVVASATSERAREVLRYEVPEAGTYTLVVTLWSGPDGAYSLALERSETCTFDADCAASEHCRVAHDADANEVVRECGTWTSPGCGGGPEEGGGDVYSDSAAFPLVGGLTGSACAGDVDVFAVDKPAGIMAFVDVSATLAEGETLYLTVVQPSGEVFGVVPVGPGPGTAGRAATIGAAAAPGRWLAYVEAVGGGGELSYDIEATLRPACRSDEGCAGGEVCGYAHPLAGYVAVCAPPADDPCDAEGEDDDSRGTARPLEAGAPVSAEACEGGLDHHLVTLEAPSTDVTLTLSWAGAADLDLTVYAADGTSLGAAWYGQPEVWEGQALPAGDLLVMVHTFGCAGGPCEGAVPYTLALTEEPGTGCEADRDCRVGGVATTPSNDPFRRLACREPDEPAEQDGGVADGGQADAGLPADDGLADGGLADGGVGLRNVCMRPSPAGLVDQAAGEDCYEALDCEGVRCVARTCTSSCSAQEDCDAAFGEGAAHCFETTPQPFCLERCEDTSDCLRVFGESASMDCQSGQCVFSG